MRYSICVIDDAIPADGIESVRDTDLLNSSNLQLLLAQDKKPWTDEIVKNLIDVLIKEKNTDGTFKWDVCGFTNPAFYLNSLDSGLFRSDIVVYDWDYPSAGAGVTSESMLSDILDKTFCLVFIFSSADKKEVIEVILAKPEFQKYKERLFYLDKAIAGADQTTILLQEANNKYEDNFSFRLAGDLRKKTIQGVDKILSDMGKASLSDIKNYVAIGDGGKKDFIDFLAERFKAAMADQEVYDLIEKLPDAIPEGSSLSDSVIAAIWSYRLYFHMSTGDDLIRRGDILEKDKAFYLVLSADCDLGRFWKKNLGIINTVALHELDTKNTSLKELLTYCDEPEKLASGSFNNLLDQVGTLSQGPFILPFVPVEDSLKQFVALPKEIASERIALPGSLATLTKGQLKNEPLKYSYWADAKKICTVAEPFLTPVIQHALAVVGGYGVPDYPSDMKGILKKILEDFGTIEEAKSKPITKTTKGK